MQQLISSLDALGLPGPPWLFADILLVALTINILCVAFAVAAPFVVVFKRLYKGEAPWWDGLEKGIMRHYAMISAFAFASTPIVLLAVQALYGSFLFKLMYGLAKQSSAASALMMSVPVSGCAAVLLTVVSKNPKRNLFCGLLMIPFCTGLAIVGLSIAEALFNPVFSISDHAVHMQRIPMILFMAFAAAAVGFIASLASIRARPNKSSEC